MAVIESALRVARLAELAKVGARRNNNTNAAVESWRIVLPAIDFLAHDSVSATYCSFKNRNSWQRLAVRGSVRAPHVIRNVNLDCSFLSLVWPILPKRNCAIFNCSLEH